MIDQNNIDRRVFETAYLQYTRRLPLLATRQRLKRYTYGDQWSDVIRDSNGSLRLESELIRASGRRPITNNLIRRLIKTIVGRYRDMAAQSGVYDNNSAEELDELDSRLLEEFLISGMACQRIADDNPLTACSPGVVNISPDALLCNDFRDPRGRDIDMVGMLHDMSPAEARLRFAPNGGDDARRLEHTLAVRDIDAAPSVGGAATFSYPANGRVRVIEVWTREFAENGQLAWRARWYAPSGVMLDTYLSPWRHASHPFVLKFYPLTDGEVHSFVEDVVDQQRYINRLIVLIDRIMATSAKGVLLFPVDQKIKNMSWNDIAGRWAASDGIIPITGRAGAEMPRQVSFSGGDANAHRLLELELKLFDEVSGVGSALLGDVNNSDAGVTGANLYNARVQNATIALADIYKTFASLITARTAKLNNL